MTNNPATKQLPCSQCPHGAKCCNFGASLEPDEALALISAHGPMSVQRPSEGENRWISG